MAKRSQVGIAKKSHHYKLLWQGLEEIKENNAETKLKRLGLDGNYLRIFYESLSGLSFLVYNKKCQSNNNKKIDIYF